MNHPAPPVRTPRATPTRTAIRCTVAAERRAVHLPRVVRARGAATEAARGQYPRICQHWRRRWAAEAADWPAVARDRLNIYRPPALCSPTTRATRPARWTSTFPAPSTTTTRILKVSYLSELSRTNFSLIISPF